MIQLIATVLLAIFFVYLIGLKMLFIFGILWLLIGLAGGFAK